MVRVVERRQHPGGTFSRAPIVLAWPGPRTSVGTAVADPSPAEEGTLESGTPYGSTSGFMYENMPSVAKTKYVLTHEVFGITDYDLKYRLILRLALPHPNITHIACANPSTLVKLLSVLDVSRAALLREITEGTFSRADELSADVRAAVSSQLSCSTPNRIAELRTILGSPRPTFAQLWPELRLVSTWTGGSCRIPLASIRPALPPNTRIAKLGYLASELRGTLVADVAQNAGTPTIHENFFEFVERDDWDADRTVFRTIEQLDQGNEYYVFPTTGAGLYRYFMNDIRRPVSLMRRICPRIQDWRSRTYADGRSTRRPTGFGSTAANSAASPTLIAAGTFPKNRSLAAPIPYTPRPNSATLR